MIAGKGTTHSLKAYGQRDNAGMFGIEHDICNAMQRNEMQSNAKKLSNVAYLVSPRAHVVVYM